MIIDWSRVAKPQPDAYDSHVLAYFLKERYGWERIPATSPLRLCDGKVAVVKDRTHQPGQEPNPLEPMSDFDDITPEILGDIDHFLMKAWPEGGLMLQTFLDEYWPKWSRMMAGPDVPFGARRIPSRGSSSGHYEMKNSKNHGHLNGVTVNAVYVACNDPQGCAEGIYHEVGHARLEAIGLEIESHDNMLLLNGPDELYDSPVRWDQKRPMSAVVQAVYSWIVFTENDIQCAVNLPGYDIKDPEMWPMLTPAEASAGYMITNIPKIQDGLDEIRKYAKLTPEGVKFFDGYLEWGDSVVTRGIEVLKSVHKENFDTVYAKALQYREERLRVLEEVKQRKEEDANYIHGIAKTSAAMKEILGESDAVESASS